MSEEDLPTEIGRETLEVAPGLKIEAIQLDNGQRLITGESLEAFLNWIQGHGEVSE